MQATGNGSPHDTNRLGYFTSDLIYKVYKSKILTKCNAKEFDCWNFLKDWFSNFIVEWVFLVGDYHIWSLTNFQRKSIGIEPVINSNQFPVYCGMNIVNATVGCKIYCMVSEMIKIQQLYRQQRYKIVSSATSKQIEDLCMSFIYKRKSTGPYTEPCGTPNVVFDIEELEFLTETYCFLFLKQDLN